jgi:hypothetical protein
MTGRVEEPRNDEPLVNATVEEVEDEEFDTTEDLERVLAGEGFGYELCRSRTRFI